MKKPTDENLTVKKLTRLLEEAAGPRSIPSLEPDPYLPARIRVMAREDVQAQASEDDPTRRWVPVWVAATALAVAVVTGGYIGYTTGTSLAAENVDVAPSDDTAREIDTFAEVWSQAGFADDLTTVETNGQ